MIGVKKPKSNFVVNEALLNVITPMGLEIKRNNRLSEKIQARYTELLNIRKRLM